MWDSFPKEGTRTLSDPISAPPVPLPGLASPEPKDGEKSHQLSGEVKC